MPERTALYHLYDAEEQLLYVGISTYPAVRFKQHAGDKVWWHHVARHEITWLDSRDEALKAEAGAMVEERPLYNGYHHLGKGWPQKARKYDDTAERTLVREGMRVALERGDYRPGAYLQGAPVGRQFGVSALIGHYALSELADEGILIKRQQHFTVPQQSA